ncbi:PilN domain-containing protein [Candidatus Peregrinibacteria bacterium]|nr:PilN domain-containing protein [Candidatus Peregrinibacteria bacterium]
MDKSYEAPKGRLLSTLVIFAFVLGLLYAGFLFFRQMRLNSELERLEASKIEVTAQMADLRKQQVEEVLTARDLSEKVSAASLKWSKVIKRLQELTPTGVFYKAYTGVKDGSLQISALGDSYASVSSVIGTILASGDFTDVFVPSVSLGTTSEGKELVTFTLQLKSKSDEK